MPALTGSLTSRPRRHPLLRRGRTGRGTLRPALAVLTIAPVLVAVAACSSSSSSTGGAGGAPSAGSSSAGPSPATSATSSAEGSVATTTYPVTVKAGNGDVTIAARPKAIVSLAPALTEMLYAIDAGGQVKAVDDQSDFPANAPRTKLSGFQPNAEAIAGYAPDLVVLSNDVKGLAAALTKLKVPVLVLAAPKTIDEAYTQTLVLGQATGHPAQAQASVELTKKRIAAAVASVPADGTKRKVYHEVDQTYYSVTGATFIGDLYKQFGLVNIADSAPPVAGGYPQLSAEFVVQSAPDLIVLADGKCCQQSAATVAKRPAFASVPAVMGGRVLVIDDDIASRWGPRLADFAEAISKTLHGVG